MHPTIGNNADSIIGKGLQLGRQLPEQGANKKEVPSSSKFPLVPLLAESNKMLTGKREKRLGTEPTSASQNIQSWIWS